jgi:hypothetical protein
LVEIAPGVPELCPDIHTHTHPDFKVLKYVYIIQKTLWPESARELYRPSGCRLSVKLVPTFADKGCHVVNVTDPYGHILGFLDWSSYIFFQRPVQSTQNRKKTQQNVARGSHQISSREPSMDGICFRYTHPSLLLIY